MHHRIVAGFVAELRCSRLYLHELDVCRRLRSISPIHRPYDDVRVDFDEVVISESLHHLTTNKTVAVVNEDAVLVGLLGRIREFHLLGHPALYYRRMKQGRRKSVVPVVEGSRTLNRHGELGVALQDDLLGVAAEVGILQDVHDELLVLDVLL